MKTLRRLCAVLALTLALTLSAFAGEIATGITAPPPPPPDAVTTGDMQTGVTGEISTSAAGQISTGVTDAALSLLQSLMSLF